jgi:CotH kinase protein
MQERKYETIREAVMNLRFPVYVAIAMATVAIAPSAVRAQFSTGPDQPLLTRFDKDGDKKLNAAERRAALSALGGGGGGFYRGSASPRPGPALSPAAVESVPATVPLYDPGTLRTLFFQFEDDTWESELMAFKETDIEVPATLVVDGKTYKEVGVKFRGSSSFMMVPQGLKHSISLSMDAFTKDQSILGYESLNLLSSHADPTFLRGVLYLSAARDFLPAAKANFVRVVINGESWGVYQNVEQVNKAFLKEWYKTDAGVRWKAPGRPNGRLGLEYWGDNVASYKSSYEIKGKDDPKAWAALINLTRVLNNTPPDRLEAALTPILDIDGVLRFLAIDAALANYDGYWVRASDYNLYLDGGGKFHILPHDINEAFGGGGPGPDLLVGLNDPSKPLRSKLLALPALRAKYLQYAREIATKWLDWNTLEPLVTKYQALIAADVKTDTRKIDSTSGFESGATAIKAFADRRRQQILSYPQK